MAFNLVTQYNDCIRRIEFYREHKKGSPFDSFYHSHLDFMHECLEYRLKHETILEVETAEECPHCKKKLTYKVLNDKRNAEKYNYYKDSLELRIAVCISCGEELEIPSIEETNKKLVAPYLEKQEKGREKEVCLLPLILEDNVSDVLELLVEEKGETQEEKIEGTPQRNSLMNGWNSTEVCSEIFNSKIKTNEDTPTNPKIFEALMQPSKDSLVYTDALAKIVESEKVKLYNLIKTNISYVASFTKFPMYMIKEMIEINPEVVLYLKDVEFETILIGLEYAKRHYYGKELSSIINHLSSNSKYNILMRDTYGADWNDKFLEPLSCPERINQIEEEK